MNALRDALDALGRTGRWHVLTQVDHLIEHAALTGDRELAFVWLALRAEVMASSAHENRVLCQLEQDEHPGTWAGA